MFKKIVRTLLGLSLLAAAAPSLLAEMNFDHQIRVAVPFAFSAKDTIMPAGEYTITVNPDNGTIMIRGEKQSPVILTTIHKESLDQFGRGRLVFHNDGTTRFLTEVWTRGASDGFAIPYKEDANEAGKKHSNAHFNVQIP